MRYVIDACNLIFRDSRLEQTLEADGFQAARARLVAMIGPFVRVEDVEEAILVFDGSEKAAHRPRRQTEASGRIVLIYADPRQEADRFIIDYVEDAKRPGEITVVSSDKFIIRQVQRAQGRHLNCRDFLRRLRAARRKAADPFGGEDPRKFSGTLSARDIEEWMQWFGFSEKQ
jgi:predicted RNA-binding protein with PIN domain